MKDPPPDYEEDDEKDDHTNTDERRRSRSHSKEFQRFSKDLTEEHLRYLSKEIDERDVLILKIDHEHSKKQLPSFMTIMYLIITDIVTCHPTRTLCTYGYCLWWKIKGLFKITFGIWDDELMRGMQIVEKAAIFDEDLEDDISHHDDMIRLKGQAHSLIWQFAPLLVVLAKLSEAINESPLYIKPKEQKVVVAPLCGVDDAKVADHDTGFYNPSHFSDSFLSLLL